VDRTSEIVFGAEPSVVFKSKAQILGLEIESRSAEVSVAGRRYQVHCQDLR
jgi:hypothetical protein